MNLKYTPSTLKKMEQLYEEARYRVRYEKGNFNSGYCIIEDKKIAVINKFLNIEGRINALVEILPTIGVQTDELSTEMQKWYFSLTGQEVRSDTSIQAEIDLNEVENEDKE